MKQSLLETSADAAKPDDDSIGKIGNIKLFNNLIDDITNLISGLEKNLLDYEKSLGMENRPINKTPSNKLGLFQKLSSIWPFKNFSGKSSKPSLREYLDFNEKINDIANQIIIENFEIFDLNEQIKDILINFNKEFSNTIRKYATILQKDYEDLKTSYIKATGSPDSTPDSTIQDDSIRDEHANSEIFKSINAVMKTEKVSFQSKSEIKNSFFENGNIKPEFFGQILDYLLNNDIDIKNEEELKRELGPSYNPSASLYSKLLKIYKTEEEIDKMEAKIINRNAMINNVSPTAAADLIAKWLLSLPENQMDKTIEEIIQMDQDKEKLKKAIQTAKQKEENIDDIQWQILSNMAVNDEMRKVFLNTFHSS